MWLLINHGHALVINRHYRGKKQFSNLQRKQHVAKKVLDNEQFGICKENIVFGKEIKEKMTNLVF